MELKLCLAQGEKVAAGLGVRVGVGDAVGTGFIVGVGERKTGVGVGEGGAGIGMIKRTILSTTIRLRTPKTIW